MDRARVLTRRGLLRGGAGALAGGPHMLTSAALGAGTRPAASERLGIGLIGAGKMGVAHLAALRLRPDVVIRAVADVHAKQRDEALRVAGASCASCRDFRELLARPDIDAVVIATPDHWHALAAILACEAGKDVYCEKPLSLTIAEGRAIVRAARRYGTVFQVGSQQRSNAPFRRACELVRSGRIGRLQQVRVGLPEGPACGWEPDQPPPPALDWDMWLGPAPWSAYTPKRCLRTFRYFYDYAGGVMTDWGAHHVDIAQWGIGADRTGPVKTEPLAASFPEAGLYDTAMRFHVRHTYENGVVLHVGTQREGVRFEGSEGWIEVDRGRFAASDPDIAGEPTGAGDVRLERSADHRGNWLACIRRRRRPICDVEIGCRSATVCHLGTIALRTGKTLSWDPASERITSDESLNRWLDRPYRTPWRRA